MEKISIQITFVHIQVMFVCFFFPLVVIFKLAFDQHVASSPELTCC